MSEKDELVARLRNTTQQMAVQCSVDGILWSEHCSAVLEAADFIERYTRIEPEAADRGVPISRELYAFLMGEGPLEGVWFGDLNKGLRGAFWWRALLRCAAGWPDPPAIQSLRSEPDASRD